MMTLKARLAGITIAAICLTLPVVAGAAEDEQPARQEWSFAGPFGKFDQAQIQRGLKVYREVCSVCHGLNYIAFRNLADAGGPGYSLAQAGAIAAEYQIEDGPNDQGEMFQRPGRLADYFPTPWKNEQEARARFNGGLPPDLSMVAKARTYERGFPWFIFDMFTQYQEQGPDYIVALMEGYTDAPKDFPLPPGTQYNKAFPAHSIAMPPPLSDGRVEYTDGTPQKVDNYAHEVAAFLVWASEPHMEARKRIGFQVMIFLIVLAGLLYFTKKKVWHDVHGQDPSKTTI
jgi:ubiquinol-cytochrome c reductase cytochrome b/c1 subunit